MSSVGDIPLIELGPGIVDVQAEIADAMATIDEVETDDNESINTVYNSIVSAKTCVDEFNK